MANVTDPLAAAVHGTDPQSLMEYITRQKIYDSRYWKEECFGLTAADVLEKASQLKCIGASHGGNARPTHFLCLVLKLLQIHPPQEQLIQYYLQQEEFSYVRALGAFCLRLTGRPADIYRQLEHIYVDYRKLRYRQQGIIDGWKWIYMDQFIHWLLTEERVCGITLPRLAARSTLLQEGYLDQPYISPLQHAMGDLTLEQYLHQKVEQGSPAAKLLLQERRQAAEQSNNKDKQEETKQSNETATDASTIKEKKNNDKRESNSGSDNKKSSKKNKRKENYGTLFKSKKKKPNTEQQDSSKDGKPEEFSTEYWNQERAKLGLKPLK